MILREIFARLGLDVDAQSFAKGQLAAALVKGALEKVVDIAKESAEKFVELVKETAEYGKETKEAAQATGLTTEALQQLRGAAKASGVESADLDVGLFKLSRTMYAVKKGGEEQAKTFSHLKVKVTDAHGQLRATDDVLVDLADRFSKMPDGPEKTALAMEVFGRSGARLIPMLNKGKEGLDALRSSAVVMSEDQIEAGEELVKTQRQLANVTTKLWRGAIAPLLPEITKLLKQYLAWRKANAEIMRQQIQKYLGYVVTAIKGVGNAFSFLIKNATAIKWMIGTTLVYAFAQLEVASIRAAISTAAAWLAAAAPFVALAALVAGILLVFDDIRVYQKGGKSLYGRFKNEIESWLKPRDQDPWFVVAIKDFVRLIDQAIKLIDEFYEATGRVNPRKVDQAAAASKKQIDYNTAVQSQRAARRRAELGLPLTAADIKAIEATGGTEKSFLQRYGAKGPLAPPSADELATASTGGPALYTPDTARGPVIVQGPQTQLTVYAAPGMSEEQVAKIATDKIAEHWNEQMEAAGAAVGD